MSQAVEIVTGKERRRQWSEAEKRRLAAEAFAPGEVVAHVARRHGVAESCLYAWRKRYCGSTDDKPLHGLGLVPVMIGPSPPAGSVSSRGAVVTLPDGTRLEIDAGYPVVALKALLGSLRRSRRSGSHPIARGRAGPGLLAHVLFSKYGAHLPLHRQSAIYAREGIELDVSTLADWVGASAATLMPLIEAIRTHVLAASRIHADDTPVPVLAKGKTRTGRLWVYVRDDRPFGGSDPPGAAFFYSADRGSEHAERHLAGYAGAMQADAYAGFNRLYEPNRKPGPIIEVACWAHGRRKFYELARLKQAPIAIEAVRRIDALFAIEREINGASPEARRATRQERARPLIGELETWLRQQRAKLSTKTELARAIDYSLKRWPALTGYLDDGRLCMSNNAAERALRAVAVGRHNWTFAGSDAGGERAAAIYTVIETCKLNAVDPRAWLADVLARLQDHPAKRIAELLPWNWRKPQPVAAQAA